MRIDQVVQSAVSKADQAAGRAIQKKGGQAASVRLGDSVELSKSAGFLRGAGMDADRAPEVRSEKVEQAMARIREGFYNKPEARERLATELAGSPALAGDIRDARKAARAKASSAPSGDRTATARERAAGGYYDSPEVRGAVADRVAEAISR